MAYSVDLHHVASSWQPSSGLPVPGQRVGPEVPTGAQKSVLAFAPVKLTTPEAAAQWHLTLLGDIEAVWADYRGKGVSVGIYDTGVQRSHWDLEANYDAGRHVVVDGKTYDGDWDPQSEGMGHGTAVAGIIAAQRNGRGGMGVSHEATITGVNIFNPYSEDGVAPGIYIGSDDLSKFLSAFDQASRFDVVNHSWGGFHGYRSAVSRDVEGSILHAMATSMAKAAENGRDGLGTIQVNASGNTTTMFFGATHEQSDSWKGDRHAITVGAYRADNGSAAFYSVGGPHLLVSAPSTDFAFLDNPNGVVTTDLTGYWGYNRKATPGGKDDYTDTFDGTSAAAPIVTGVVSLMLDANEGLGWRDVSNILAASARMPVAFDTRPTIVTATAEGGGYFYFEKGGNFTLNNSVYKLGGADANWNGGRMHYSTDYGFGAVDAHAAVRMAEVWSLFGAAKTSANEASIDTGTLRVGLSLPSIAPDAIPAGTVYHDFVGNKLVGAGSAITFDVAGDVAVEHVDLTLDVRTQTDVWKTDPVTGEQVIVRGDVSISGLRFKVTAPDGTEVFMDTYGSQVHDVDGVQTFTFGLAAFRGVETSGTWKIAFENLGGAFESLAVVESMRFKAFGAVASVNDVHHYTEEFGTMTQIAGEDGRRTLSDLDGGVDWIDAAAVRKNVDLSLVAGATTKFGGADAFVIARGTQIEHAVTGDGDDRLSGNALDNKLYAMRGVDWLNGAAGNDTLYGGQGGDVFAFDTAAASGRDRILDWSTGDRIATSKMLRGADQNGLVTVGSNALVLLDNNARGDTAELVDQGGAVLQALGRSNGYWWYGFVSEGDEDFVDGRVREAALGQTARVANDTLAADHGAAAATSLATGVQDGAFFLYDTMGDAMTTGVQVWA